MQNEINHVYTLIDVCTARVGSYWTFCTYDRRVQKKHQVGPKLLIFQPTVELEVRNNLLC
jgi:hypothetical protein